MSLASHTHTHTHTHLADIISIFVKKKRVVFK